ncbi:carboxypeptidase-like regulatory domain-containing protein [Alteromonas sp. S167]|uniref:carboxypeptidase-like regulatory domain-containing protein n=1 Tax=Alteromonas sp. S167 TaxID=3117402 RepID=UPI002FE15B87
MRLWCAACCILLSFCSYAEVCNTPSSFKKVTLSDDDFLISVLRLNGQPILDGFDVYAVNDRLLIPASLFIDAMSLDWELNIQSGYLAYSDENESQVCSFEINFENMQDPSALFYWATDEFDLYIDVELIPSLLSVEYEYNLSLLHLNLFSNSLDANKKDNAIHIPNFFKPDNAFADRTIDDEYQWYTSPLVSYRIAASKTRSQSERTSINFNSAFDLASHATNFRVSRVNDKSNHFLRFSRHIRDTSFGNPNTGLTYEFGDIQLLGDNLVTNPSQSLGFVLHNANQRGQRNFSKTTIEEFVLPGWRVQLFRNSQFIDEKFSDEQNRVVFEDVDTFYGNNLFELKLYGPEGQQETRTQTISVGEDQTQRGSVNFFLGASDNQYRLLDGQISDVGLGKSTIAKLGYGLTDSTTISASTQKIWINDEPLSYFAASIDTQFVGSALNASITKQKDRGIGAFFGWSGRIDSNLAFNFTHSQLNDFVSHRFDEARGLESETALRFNGKTTFGNRLGWNANLSRRTFSNRDEQNIVSLALNDTFLGGTASGGLTYTDNQQSSLLGRLYYSKLIEGWQVASSWDFKPSEHFDTESFYVALRWPYLLKQNRETRLQYRANGSSKLELLHTHNWSFDSFNLGMGASVAEGGDWSFNLTLTGNINYDPYASSFSYDRAATTSAGRVDAFAFFDKNRNNAFDGDDYAIEGVQFDGHARWKNNYTNENGRARLLTGHMTQSLSIKPSSLPDPFMVPTDNLVDVQTHGGGISRVELAVQAVNDVEGTVYLVGSTSSRGAPNLLLNVVDEDYTVVTQTRTESDGYFYMDRLPPGKYKLLVDDKYLERNNLVVQNGEIEFIAPEEGDVIFLDDIQVMLPTDDANDNAEVVMTEPSVQTNVSYEIQVGIFRHARSIHEVLKQLPVPTNAIQYYRNHNVAMTYVTVGQFDSFNAANAFLDTIKTHPAFSNAFVSPVSRYVGNEWRKEAVYTPLEERIEQSLSAIENTPNTVLCQLSAYYSKSSINPEILFRHQALMLLPNKKNNAEFYRLIAPMNADNDCTDDYFDSEYRKQPFKVNKDAVLPR